eukprot:8900959-Pyramimonas_sp.AAC.1
MCIRDRAGTNHDVGGLHGIRSRPVRRKVYKSSPWASRSERSHTRGCIRPQSGDLLRARRDTGGEAREGGDNVHHVPPC